MKKGVIVAIVAVMVIVGVFAIIEIDRQIQETERQAILVQAEKDFAKCVNLPGSSVMDALNKRADCVEKITKKLRAYNENYRIQTELEEVYADIDKFVQYESEMNSLQIDDCWKIDLGSDTDYMPNSFRELRDDVKEREYLTKEQVEDMIWKIDRDIPIGNVQEIEEYRTQLLILEEKYLGSQYEDNFLIREYECDNMDYWVVALELLIHYGQLDRSQISEMSFEEIVLEAEKNWTPNTSVSKNSEWIGLSFHDDNNKLVEIYNDFGNCIDEHSLAWCLDSVESRVEKLCEKYHSPKDNCTETTIHELRMWAYGHLS